MIIHFVWFNFKEPGIDVPDKKIPKRYRKAMKRWAKLHPEHQIKLWKDEEAACLVEDYYEWFVPCYRAFKHPIQRVDVFRLIALHRFGGFYADMDSLCKQNIDSALDSTKSLHIVLNRHLQKTNMENWFLGTTVPRHPFFELALHKIQDEQLWFPFQATQKGGGSFFPVLMTTGPIMLRSCLTEYQKQSNGAKDVQILDQDDFRPWAEHLGDGLWIRRGAVAREGVCMVIAGIIVLLLMYRCLSNIYGWFMKNGYKEEIASIQSLESLEPTEE